MAVIVVVPWSSGWIVGAAMPSWELGLVLLQIAKC